MKQLWLHRRDSSGLDPCGSVHLATDESRCGRGKFILGVGTEDGLRPDDDDLELADDLAGCA
jgi:hypothetical protein